MAPKMSVFVALNVAVFFALVSGCDKCPPPVTNTSGAATAITTTTTTTTATLSSNGTGCPRDVLKLGVCSGVLNGWLNFTTGFNPKKHCCAVIEGLVDFEVAVCICTALRANVMGININIPISFTQLVNTCDKKVPEDFICA